MRDYLIIDVEATCWEGTEKKKHRSNSEIIEIGWTVVDQYYESVNGDSLFIKPVRNPILSDFCKNLTHITQEQVDNAKAFPEAMKDLKFIFNGILDWFLFCSWGAYDKTMFVRDCVYHKYQYPFGLHFNLKDEFAIKRMVTPVGVDKALEICELKPSGTRHRGYYDAIDIAKILCKEKLIDQHKYEF